MRHIDGVYTQRHNRRKKTDGPLFRGRYKAIVIDASNYLLQVSRYIHRNPVEMKKPLVKQLEEYPWSSYAAYLNEVRVPDWLNRDLVYGELGSKRRFSAYRAYVAQGNDKETSRFYELKHTPSIWGDKTFKELAYGQAQSLDIEIDRKGLKQPVPLPEVLRKVAVHYGIAISELQVAKRGKGSKNLPRWIAMKLCQEVSGAKLIEIATVFNVGHYSTVSQTIGRLNNLLNEDAHVKRSFNVLSQDLTP